MNDKERADLLENALSQMLKPLKNVPFLAIIRALSEHKIIQFDRESETDKALLDLICEAARICFQALKEKPILRPRPNEVGNDIEAYVKNALQRLGVKCEKPKTSNGKQKSVGYPDLLLEQDGGRFTYIECKIFNKNTKDSSMRSFYLSPSEDFKVTCDARHLLLAFEMESQPARDGKNREYRATGYKLVDLHNLLCNVKYEFNADNVALYHPKSILAQATFVD